MRKLTKQILLRLSPETDELIDRCFSMHLRSTGAYISRSDFVRSILEEQLALLAKTEQGDGK